MARSLTPAAVAGAILLSIFGTAKAEMPSGAPITIGFSMPLTGGLAVNGTSGLLAMQVRWPRRRDRHGTE